VKGRINEFEGSDDTDIFISEANAGRYYALNMFGDSLDEAGLDEFDVDENFVGSANRDSGDVTMDFRARLSGTYYMVVSSPWGQLGTYELSVEQCAPPASPTPMAQDTDPPTSGSHLSSLSRYGFLGEPLVPEAVVHNMEHGAAVIWYQQNDSELAAQVLHQRADLGSECLVAESYPDMFSPVVVMAATVWDRLLPLKIFDADRLRRSSSLIAAERGQKEAVHG
jgi:hypothetical protein